MTDHMANHVTCSAGPSFPVAPAARLTSGRPCPRCGGTLTPAPTLPTSGPPTGLTPTLIGFEGRTVEVVEAKGTRRRFKVGVTIGPNPVHLEFHRAKRPVGYPVSGTPFLFVRAVDEPRKPIDED